MFLTLADSADMQADLPLRSHVYTYPSRKTIKAVTAKVKAIFRRNVNQPLQTLIRQLNPALRAGAPTSGPACPLPPSLTWPATLWAGSCDGHGANTAGSP